MAFASKHSVNARAIGFEQFMDDPAQWLAFSTHVIAMVNDNDLSVLLQTAETHHFSLGIVPVSSSSVTYRLFALPRKTDTLLMLAFTGEGQSVDIALCNDDVVLGMLMLGDTPFLDSRSKRYKEGLGWLARFWLWIRAIFVSIGNLFAIHPFPLTLTTGRDVSLNTAVTGLVVLENEVRGPAARLVNASISVQDAKISVVVIAPKSVIEYLWFVLVGLFPGLQKGKQLPGALSYIKTDSLDIISPKSLTYFVDGRKRESSKLHIRLHPRSVKINLTSDYFDFHESSGEQKDTMKIENLPENEQRVAMIQKHLPFFTHALTEDFKDLFLLLKDNTRIRPDYITLMILSSLVGALGLFLNSAAVIIGAMVLAPLMSPIISLSMGALRSDFSLFRDSLVCIAVGVVLAVLTAALVALIVPIQKMTPEIAARLQPSLLDLGVAVGSGIAGAYAHARESVMKSLPGVAIAVALVPPLCVTGIGLGWMDWHIISGATLLFLTNLVGITLAGLLTFMILGFAPVTRARQGLVWSLVLMALIAIPLAVSLNNMTRHWQMEHSLLSGEYVVGELMVSLSDVQVSLQREQVIVQADVTSERMLQSEELRQLKAHIEEQLSRPVELELGYRIAL